MTRKQANDKLTMFIKGMSPMIKNIEVGHVVGTFPVRTLFGAIMIPFATVTEFGIKQEGMPSPYSKTIKEAVDRFIDYWSMRLAANVSTLHIRLMPEITGKKGRYNVIARINVQ